MLFRIIASKTNFREFIIGLHHHRKTLTIQP
jgi:hypothetical protein